MGKTFLIAGVTSGIGKATASHLIGLGHTVIGVGRNNSANVATRFFEYDFSTDDPLFDLNEPLDGLVYAPGTINLKPFQALRSEDYLADFRLNVIGALALIKKFLPNLKQGNGSVVLFSSVAAQTGLPYHTSIAASKGAIEGICKALAAEFSPEVRVNAVAPSLTDTPLAAALLNSDAKRQANADRHPLRRIGTAQDVAQAVTYLLLDAPWMTGQILKVDGGLGTIIK